MKKNRNDDVLAAMRGYVSGSKLALNAKLPAERVLAEQLGVTRAQLRTALSVLEAEGLIWRHVGRGTFVGSRPVLNLADVNYLTDHTNPSEVMEARLAMEPQLARLASLYGNDVEHREIARCMRYCCDAGDWRTYEMWDMRLHRTIALATQNKLLINLFDTLNLVRRATVWGQARSTNGPSPEYRSFHEHADIVEAIVSRDADSAAISMQRHLTTVRDRLHELIDP